MTTRIGDIRASVHRHVADLPLKPGSARGSTRVICEVETDDGRVGVGMTGRFLCHATVTAITRHILPAIKGMDIRDLEAIHGRLRKVLSERGRQSGVNLWALSAVDLALWDLIGQVSGRPVAGLLGGHRDHADVYVTFGFGDYEPDELVEVARMLIAQGHTRLKMLVGVAKDGLPGDVRRVHHVRDALGDDILLAIDANESITLDYARRLCRRIEECDIAWFEDPVRGNDPRDLAALRRGTSIPLSAGQMDGHATRFREWVEADAIDIFMPNSLYAGGMTEVRRVGAIAQIYERPISDAGGGGVYSMHHVAGLRGGTLAECHLGTDAWERMIYLDAPEPEAGRLHVPDRPGFGVTLNREAMKETLVP
ncbi:mandelate racemase/muconate lactonizing enzyme family protein [Roseitranquillus sediminis]|uniref:mandelate racemase/muconate lactonizing enzyme family protein n=1 Tax=Roseitranquillus sediminis TaxID=2809051 RepID=UPI001D0CBA5C|nr:mandelate racemase/muconate lactonizing enzyme family protein [Roseitranquillus sediminis]MBM9595435.1 mandelate racemase/muconate lactonizing enzyme family protein [Roseitranquillus sediminis]